MHTTRMQCACVNFLGWPITVRMLSNRLEYLEPIDAPENSADEQYWNIYTVDMERPEVFQLTGSLLQGDDGETVWAQVDPIFYPDWMVPATDAFWICVQSHERSHTVELQDPTGAGHHSLLGIAGCARVNETKMQMI
eukprot:NODE_25467_length_586_cov_2.549020.p1 GENE.NODE_25467_length_586_cov_2.549020~~NODE_25467_length_586_cov_2.549020.p1  ORF type:complete len:137 (-),score=29.13 NODE_25467_length_586_cov_2.549020:46-456(-)